jgi:hypothetical protein
MMHWLSRASEIGLEQGDTAFFDIAERWMIDVSRQRRGSQVSAAGGDAWKLACRFLDYLEANAEDYWEPPRFELVDRSSHDRPADEAAATEVEGGDEEVEEDLYSAAYEGVVYRDSTDDGVEGELIEYGQYLDDALMAESRRVGERLSFLSSLARLWQLAVTIGFAAGRQGPEFSEVASGWIRQAEENRARLRELLDTVRAMPMPVPSGDHDSMVEYDRVRLVKESLLEQIIVTSVDTGDAIRILTAASHDLTAGGQPSATATSDDDTLGSFKVFSAVLRGKTGEIRQGWDRLVQSMLQYPLLYVPLAKGGDPHEIVAARLRQRAVQDLLAWLPRLGLIEQTCQLVEIAREMERSHPVGPGAVTEYDELFKIGYKSLVRTVAHAATADARGDVAGDSADANPAMLIECLKQLTECLLSSWLAHSKTLRLSVLEKVKDRRAWAKLVAFIERYGADIFTQRFLNLANIRAILHHGVASWLDQLQEDMSPEVAAGLLEDLQRGRIKAEEAIDRLSLILEAIVENYGEYRDYNSMTTQSDRGELLYMLLDFLRLRTDYDRICWQLKPVVWAHEILVRGPHARAAEMWRRELAEQTNREAQAYLHKLAKLQTQYAMRMPTVADRLAERFIRPMVIDRIRALVKPAMEELQQGGDAPSFRLFRKEIELLTREPTGVGLDVPAWLVAVEEEVEAVVQPNVEKDHSAELDAMIPQVTISLDDARRQLERWSSR